MSKNTKLKEIGLLNIILLISILINGFLIALFLYSQDYKGFGIAFISGLLCIVGIKSH